MLSYNLCACILFLYPSTTCHAVASEDAKALCQARQSANGDGSKQERDVTTKHSLNHDQILSANYYSTLV